MHSQANPQELESWKCYVIYIIRKDISFPVVLPNYAWGLFEAWVLRFPKWVNHRLQIEAAVCVCSGGKGDTHLRKYVHNTENQKAI